MNDHHELDHVQDEPRQRWPLWATLGTIAAAIGGTVALFCLCRFLLERLAAAAFKPWV